MGMIVGIILVVLAIGAGVLSARLWCYKKQVGHIIRQLSYFQLEDTNYLLTSANKVGKTEEMISGLNQVLERLRQEERALRNANRSYRESITSISHDIRTPLTSVKGYVQMIQEPSLQEQKKLEYLGIIERRLEDLSGMLNQLFEFARLEAGEMELEREELNAGNLFVETISMFYEDFVALGCEPEVNIPRDPCFIQADRHAFIRIVENLIKNALVHGTGGYVFSMIPAGGKVRICIANQTDSIEAHEVERIFERFYTTDRSRSRRSTGLGLAIAQEFTRRMGGEIRANLEDGRFLIEVML
ncbi:HAMP domain-containing sensor histidine kinase [Lachnospiraceae bacterium 29-84]